MPAPSPITKPSRPVSQGRLAPAGSSLRRLRARAAPKPASEVGEIGASEPPAIITSASPYSISLPASPIAWVPVLQAVTMERFGPLRPYMIDRLPETMLMMVIGM